MNEYLFKFQADAQWSNEPHNSIILHGISAKRAWEEYKGRMPKTRLFLLDVTNLGPVVSSEQLQMDKDDAEKSKQD